MGIRVNFSTDKPEVDDVQDDGKPEVFEFESKSSPGNVHYTLLWKSGKIDCTCTGWKTHRKCWHTRQVLENANK